MNTKTITACIPIQLIPIVRREGIVLQPEEALGDTFSPETVFKNGACDSEKEKWRSDYCL